MTEKTNESRMTEAEFEAFKKEELFQLKQLRGSQVIGLLCDTANKVAEAKGFTNHDLANFCTLTTGELTEMHEHFRKGELESPSEKIPEFTNEEEEAADVVIRVFNRMGARGYGDRFLDCIIAKCEYNINRPYKWKKV